jgi:anti-sigma regulatory factor (Ser/Thr protein kinase)
LNELPTEPHAAYRHDALMYSGPADFVARTLPFIRGGLEAAESILVVTGAEKIELLRDALGHDAQAVDFADMTYVGSNPARIIPFWQDFLDEHLAAGRPMRGIGEPIWAGRGAAELVECQLHESLLNVAIGADVPMWLLCPYDTAGLDPAVIREAALSHPFLTDGYVPGPPNRDYRGDEASAAPFDVPLPEPRSDGHEFAFGPGGLTTVREIVSGFTYGAGLAPSRAADLVQAVHEVAANSVRHGGGRGVLRVWRESDRLICEIADGGRIDEPLAGRERPGTGAGARRGLWLANQLCDLVQIRCLHSGSVVRLHMGIR